MSLREEWTGLAGAIRDVVLDSHPEGGGMDVKPLVSEQELI
jgi:hypothetical protein